MITIQSEQLTPVSLGTAIELLQPFAGQKVGRIPYEVIPSQLDETTTTQDVLEQFYNGGAFRGIRSVLMSAYGRRQGEDRPYHMSQYTFREPVREGHTGTIMAPGPNGSYISYEDRRYEAQYYPDTHEVRGQSHYLDRMGHSTDEQTYSLVITPSSLLCAFEAVEMQEPQTPSHLALARTAIKQFAFDVALDTAYGLSGS